MNTILKDDAMKYQSKKRWILAVVLVCVAATAIVRTSLAADEKAPKPAREAKPAAKATPAPGPVAASAPSDAAGADAANEYKAKSMFDRGVELVEGGQEERGLKLLSSVPQMFPKAKARFKAWLYLARHYMKSGKYDLAVRNLRQLEASEDADEKGEALYQVGICYFLQDNYDKAFVEFRKVTNEYPWSVYANEAYYYIGQCHFKQGRWSKAIEALEMVGTSVPANLKDVVMAEGGQRLYVKVYDKDLVVLSGLKESFKLKLSTKDGDEEFITMDPLGKIREFFIGSLPTAPGAPKKGDGVLQFTGDELVTAEYVDENTSGGTTNQKLDVSIRLVSTASVGFTDGAYREYVKGVFADSECFMRLKDLDRDTTDAKDKLKVRLVTQYKVKKTPEGEISAAGEPDSPDDEIRTRDSIEITITETDVHTGIFIGSIIPKMVATESEVDQADEVLSAVKGDDIVVEYVDELHMMGKDPRDVKALAKILVGQIQDVKIEHRVVSEIEQKARKNLIEGKIFLKLGGIFKDVGLVQKAYEKAQEGLDRIDEVISVSLKASLDRTLVEEAFSVKWDLLLVQDKLGEAINVCRTLTKLFPDSTLVDQALFKIAVAKTDANESAEAMTIFDAITHLPKSELKAEAQYNIAKILDDTARAEATKKGVPPVLSRAMLAYQKCAEQYPDSARAGDALDAIAQYYIDTKDFARAIEMMEKVFQDYPDASFLDKMLLKWSVAGFAMGNTGLAREKAEQLLAEYPNSKMAPKAKALLGKLEERSKPADESK